MGEAATDGKIMRRVIDMRSDTVTKPTDAMRAAMANAEVDDDVLGNDPTALRLETEMVRIMGKEAALFVPSGTMGNLISILVHCDVRGSEIILGDNSHIHIYENGGIATIGGVHPRTLRNNKDGTMDLDSIEAAIRDPKGDLYYPITRVICLENSHANTGGRCLSVEYTDRVGELAKKHDLKLHIDGARIFNAATSLIVATRGLGSKPMSIETTFLGNCGPLYFKALGVPVDRLVQAADSVSVCLSKGLGAPVGTVIVGSKSFIAKAKIMRKTLGGGMRQIGVLCAAALVAVQDNVKNLETDHKNAKLLAEGFNKIEGITVDITSVETNIIYVNVCKDSRTTATKLGKTLEEHGILVMPENAFRFRVVIHHQITTSDVLYTLSCVQQAITGVLSEHVA